MKARLMRVLVYEGPIEWVQETMDRRAVKGTHWVYSDKVIREAIIGDYLEIIHNDLPPEELKDA